MHRRVVERKSVGLLLCLDGHVVRTDHGFESGGLRSDLAGEAPLEAPRSASRSPGSATRAGSARTSGTGTALEDLCELHRRELTTVFRSAIALDDVNTAIEQVLDGSAPAPRLVFRMAEATAPTANGRAFTTAAGA